MQKVYTPSELKKEIESQTDTMLESCLYAFNELRNTRLDSFAFPSTYALAAALERLIKLRKGL